HVLAEASIRATLLAALVAALLAELRIRAGAIRHAAWTAVVAAMLAMPILPSLVSAVARPIALPVRAPSWPASIASGDAAEITTVAPARATDRSLETVLAAEPPARDAAHQAPATRVVARRRAQAALPSALLLAYFSGVAALLCRTAF